MGRAKIRQKGMAMTSYSKYDLLIEPGELLNFSGDNLKIFDCRADLSDTDLGYKKFLESHISKSQYLSLEKDLSRNPGNRGRHPLPTKESWINTIRSFGIDNSDQVVLYDETGGSFAARAWWMFRWVGHEKVALLNGGWQAWEGPKSSGFNPEPYRSNFKIKSTLTKLITMQKLKTNESAQLVDARSLERWSGEKEPIDRVAGHIPSAVCYPFTENLEDGNRFKSETELRLRFQDLKEPIVCYCGSGVTAAHNILSLKIAGFSEPTLYAGSWSEWIEYDENPIARN